MKKANNRITLKTCIILYALTLPSTALYCQQLFHNAHTDTKINPTSLGKKSTTNGDSQSITSTPSSWTRAYNALPLIFISSFSTGSDTGIDAFTKNLIKQLMQRQQILSKKTELENTIAMLSAKETKESLLKKKLSKYSADLPKTEKIALENQITTDIKTAIQQTTMEIKAIEIQTAPSTIFGIAASTALIYTASAMMGALMKYGIGISIQLLMPQNR